jgi:hypothetical protein
MRKLIILSTLILLSFNCWSQSLNRINFSVDYLSCSCMKGADVSLYLSDSKLIHCYQYLFDAENLDNCRYALDSLGEDLYSLRIIISEQPEIAYLISSNQFHYEVNLFKTVFNSYNINIQRSAQIYFLQTIHNLINN